MIKLLDILLEQQDKAEKLNVLFVTDYPTDTIDNFAKRLIAADKVTGEIKSYSNQGSEEAASLVAHNISTEFDLVIIRVSGLRDKSAKELLTNLHRIIDITNRKKVPVVFIATPTTRFAKTKQQNYAYLDQVYNIIAKKADVINLTELSDDSYFMKNGVVLNKSGNQVVYKKVLEFLKTKDSAIEITPEDSEEIDSEKTKTRKIAAKGPEVKPVTDKAADKPADDSLGVIDTVKGALTAIGTLGGSIVGNLGQASPGRWQDVMRFFIGKGLTKEGAAGIAGNLKVESGFNPGVHGDKGTSYGIAQWHLTRKTALFNFAKNRNTSPSDFNTQLEYLWYELTKGYSGLLSYLKTTTDPRDAAYKFAQKFERPAQISNSRLDYAQQYASSYGNEKKAASNSSADLDAYSKLPFSYTNISSAATYPRKNEKLKSNKYFIVHHTAGRGTAQAVVNVLNKRKLGVQWVVDREGKIYQTLPAGGRGAHILDSTLGPNNSNSQGVEVIAKNDADILPIQAAAVLKLVKALGFSPSQVYGHGVVNPGHKQATEGATIVKYIKDNY